MEITFDKEFEACLKLTAKPTTSQAIAGQEQGLFLNPFIRIKQNKRRHRSRLFCLHRFLMFK